MLTIHRAERTGELVEALGRLLREPLPDAFVPEVVAVPARGVERWLAQRLSAVLGATGAGAPDGVCAGVDFPSVTGLVGAALGELDGRTGGEPEPWSAPLWSLLEVLDACLPEPWCRVPARHLGGGDPQDVRRGRRLGVGRHLAELFGSYAAHRPHMLRDWAAGLDTDGRGPLADDLRWQAELWRRLRAQLGPSPAERLPELLALLRAEPERSALPERVSLFGPTRLTADQLQVVQALAVARDVHVWLPHPGPGLWEAVRGCTAVLRRDDPTATAPRHALLRSLARDVRELQLRLPAHEERHHDGPPRPLTLLGRLQTDLRDDLPPTPSSAADSSVQLHSCHGPARQVEVLRELLLRLFQDDPTLEPRDVVVMCPDVETFAPLVSATFGLGAELPHPGHALRVRLADRSLRRTNPLLGTLAAVLDLAGGRVTAGAVLDLAADPPVRRRFGFGEQDLQRLRDWVARSGVRWGIDAAGRAPFGMDRVPQNTWRAGLDRVLLGVTTAEDEPVWLGLALPLDDVDSGDVVLAGRLAELVDRLDEVLTGLTGEHPVAHWVDVLLHALDLLTEVETGAAWQLEEARRLLAAVGEGGRGTLVHAEAQALLADRLRGRPTRAGFRTGDLTVCTLVPMRSVPHRVVVLLGLDDGVFPRTGGVDGDDVLARDPCVGERDVRGEDRQLLLDAVLAAQERLLVLYTGADPVSGARRPPAAPVGELLDVLGAMLPPGSGEADRLVVRHPLQPWDGADFRPPRPFSFDPVALDGARGRRSGPSPTAVRVPLPLRTGPVLLSDLLSFLEHPVRGHLRQRLRITLPGEDDEVDDALSVELDGLQEWSVGERLLESALRGLDPADTRRREWLRGTLPPGPLGARVLDRVQQRVDPLVEAAAPLLHGPTGAVDVQLDLPGGLLSGTVTGVRDGTVIQVGYASLSPRQRLRGYLLALVLAAAGEGDRAVTIGRYGRRARVATVVAPDSADEAAGLLAALVQLRERGLTEPLPLPLKTSAAYAAQRLGGGTVEQALDSAGREWRREHGGEREDRYHRHVWGDVALDALLEAAPHPGEQEAGEATRFGALACRLWRPVLLAEVLT